MPGKSRATMFVNSDFSDLLRLFNANSVRYLVIGGYAVVQYAEPRYTKDLDLWISTDASNAAAVFKALKGRRTTFAANTCGVCSPLTSWVSSSSAVLAGDWATSGNFAW